MNLSRAGILLGACVVGLASGTVRAELIRLGDFPDPAPLPELVYLIETDKEVYELGEEVHITHRAVNEGEVDIRFEFRYSPAFEFYILAGEERIEPWFQRLCPVIWGFTLTAGESYVTEWTWHMTDRDGIRLAPGNYDIVGIAHGGPTPVIIGADYPGPPVTSITIVPEPGMLGFVSVGFALLLGGKRR